VTGEPALAPASTVGAALAGRSVVVLGADGFLGRHICAALAAAGAHGLRISRTAAGGGGPVPQRLRPVALDLVAAPPERLAELLDGADVVVNAAGGVWQVNERQMYRANADFVARLVEAGTGLPHGPRLIHLGSVHEYSPAPPGGRVTEEQPTAPVTAYGRSKLLGAQAVLRASGGASGFHGVVLRIATVTGPGAPRGSLLGMVAHHLAGAAAAREAGAEPGPLELAPLLAHRDFVDVRDVADAVVATACAPTADVAGRVLNIGSGEAVDTRDLVARLIALSGTRVEVVERPGLAVARTDVRWQRLDISRAARLLGWRPRRGLEESLRDLLASVGRPIAARPALPAARPALPGAARPAPPAARPAPPAARPALPGAARPEEAPAARRPDRAARQERTWG
jgi:NDP-hexose 4-ketoreductase